MTRAQFVAQFPHMDYMYPSATNITYSILSTIPSAMFVSCTYVNPVGDTVKGGGYCWSGQAGLEYRDFRVGGGGATIHTI